MWPWRDLHKDWCTDSRLLSVMLKWITESWENP